jgi:hypothetical protein
VRNEQVNAILLNECLKAHRKMQEQQATIAKQQKQIEAFTTGLQKASAQGEASKFATGRIRGGGPAPQTVAKTRADCGTTGRRLGKVEPVRAT